MGPWSTTERTGLRIALILGLGGAMGSPCWATQDARVLLREGGTIAGATVTAIRSHGLDRTGRWGAVVALEGIGLTGIVNGQVVAQPGVALPNGDVPTAITQVALDDDGRTLMSYTIVALREGDPIDAFGFMPGTSASRVRGAVLAGDRLVVTVTVDEPFSATFEASLMYEVLPTGVLRAMSVLVRTGVPALGAGYVEDLISTPALGPGGEYLVPYSFNGAAGTDLTAGDFNGGPAFVTGTQGPMPGTAWASVAPKVAMSAAPGYVVGGTLEGGPQPALGVVAHLTGGLPALLALEGQPLSIQPGSIVDDFYSTDVDIANDGTVVFAVPLVGGAAVLVDHEGILLEVGVSRAGGLPITRFFYESPSVASGRPDTLHIGSDGRIVTILAELDGAGVALLEVERRVGVPEPCNAVPNSTGVLGALHASARILGAACLPAPRQRAGFRRPRRHALSGWALGIHGFRCAAHRYRRPRGIPNGPRRAPTARRSRCGSAWRDLALSGLASGCRSERRDQ